MVKVTKILYPTDFSDPSACALFYAAEMARKFDAELVMMHVLLDESQMVSFYLPQLTVKNLSKDMEDGAKAKMEEFVKTTTALDGIEYSSVMAKGIADDEIIKYANENGIDMIVLGTHGRTGLEHVIFGSTAEKVVRAAKCPVLTVHCPG
jgi:nucleotide-binding universal stress UspA family protein